MVSKLKLDKASKDNPKYIEVLLPYTAMDEKATPTTSTFAQEAFRGIWQVLGSYYQKGVVESPSGTLDGKSTENDWEAVAYDAAKEGSTAKVLDKRLAKTDGQSTLTRIDGIITMNDYIASEVVKELDHLDTPALPPISIRRSPSRALSAISPARRISAATPCRTRSNPLKTTTQTTHPVPMTMRTRTPPLPTRTVTRSGL